MREYTTAKKELPEKGNIRVMSTPHRHTTVHSSAKRLNVGGAAILAMQARNHRRAMLGIVISIPLLSIRFRE